MIRINLLGLAKGKKGKRSSASSMPSISMGSSSPTLLFILIVVVGLVLNGGYYFKLVHDRDRIAREMQAAEIENRRLAQVKSSYMEAEKEKELYKRRIDVIEQLHNNQMGPVTLLSTIGDTVNATDAVWLVTMKEDGNNINLDGMALSPSAVANLMRNLQKTGYFKTVEIKETFQDDTVKEIQAFQFTLTCERAQQQTQPVPPTQPPTQAQTQAPPAQKS
jgi:type IV pilus assembly protein PilN